MKKTLLLVFIAALLLPSTSTALSPEEVSEILTTLDERQKNSGDWKAMIYIDQKEKNKNDIVYKAVTYRRDGADKLMILFLDPRSEKGKGYLRMDKNLWFFDPRIGKWERRTERERIGGTGSNRADFDESRLSQEYDAVFVKSDKLGKFDTHVLELTAKKGIDVAYPKLKMWVDVKNTNILKRQDIAISGKLLRTSYYPKWKKIFSESKGGDVWFPKEMRIFDEVEKGNRTLIVIENVDLNALPKNIFTKAWLEAKSR